MRYFIICLILLSCKPSNKKNTPKTELNNFEIHIDAIVPKDDFFEVFYLEENSNVQVNFSEEKKIKKKVNASKKVQRITFILPEKARLHQFRLDFGSNQFQKEIITKSITLSYMNNSILINSDLIKIFFRLNKFIHFNGVDGKMNLKIIANKKDPFVIAKPILIKKIELEL
ncbi:hypothetical protein BW723_03000 [Polaribacter reichenbachii]|uniref:Uncharacterized protein n=1 Tax=Polaribacter reichenbachii TaxID=996801 RepID=A0A1B8TVP0_9FLAO|nr:hypothetical protein [Polaribacter reichenbachii]APZ45329.1 hypothetical protein BW723_03000 [Polaribacter reichenbachii]AUC19191.1 hypothetical protein BTO17_11005 [Polaribacter reichenbachii]OBY63652.1 hypothetical protein LPB301_12700 [Polaribacter reichenbachii]